MERLKTERDEQLVRQANAKAQSTEVLPVFVPPRVGIFGVKAHSSGGDFASMKASLVVGMFFSPCAP